MKNIKTNQDRTAEYLKIFNREKTIKHLIQEVVPIIFDVGANNGSSAKEFKGLWPDAKIHCFEPQEECWNDLDNLEKEYNDNNSSCSYSSNYGGNHMMNQRVSSSTVSGSTVSVTIKNREAVKISSGISNTISTGVSGVTIEGGSTSSKFPPIIGPGFSWYFDETSPMTTCCGPTCFLLLEFKSFEYLSFFRLFS